MTERVWTIAAGLLLIAALVLLWLNNLSATFVAATLGIVAWFLGYRTQLRAKIASEPQETNEQTDEE